MHVLRREGAVAIAAVAELGGAAHEPEAEAVVRRHEAVRLLHPGLHFDDLVLDRLGVVAHGVARYKVRGARSARGCKLAAAALWDSTDIFSILLDVCLTFGPSSRVPRKTPRLLLCAILRATVASVAPLRQINGTGRYTVLLL